MECINDWIRWTQSMYAVVDSKNYTKKAKSVKNNVIARTIMFDDYVRCSNEEIEMTRHQSCIQSKLHEIYTISESKIALSPYDTQYSGLDGDVTMETLVDIFVTYMYYIVCTTIMYYYYVLLLFFYLLLLLYFHILHTFSYVFTFIHGISILCITILILIYTLCILCFYHLYSIMYYYHFNLHIIYRMVLTFILYKFVVNPLFFSQKTHFFFLGRKNKFIQSTCPR